MEAPLGREVLENERSAALVRVQTLEAELEALTGDSVDAPTDDEHDPEGSTLAYERARTAALLGSARDSLDELHRALAKLAAGRYSVCEECGKPISLERLAALPAIRTCFACAATGPCREAGGRLHLP